MAKAFLDEDFLLSCEPARRLFHEYAQGMPIFDYHCHLPVAEVADNRRFENLSRIWLTGDHYKWRAMRAQGVAERLITGDAPDYEKFEAWAATVPYTVRNPIYHWTHMELKDPFGITGRLLGPATARGIYEACTALLQGEDFRARGLMRHFRVRVVCTTDDPVDDLEQHRRIAAEADLPFRVYPAFRPDKAMAVEKPEAWNRWVDRLGEAAGRAVGDYGGFLEALRSRHAFFHAAGCRLSDHGIEEPYAADFTERQASAAFARLRAGQALEPDEVAAFKSAVLYELALMDGEAGWTQQFHFGALRNTNTRAMGRIGPDSGYDAIGDFALGRPLVRLLDRLDSRDRLARTVLYSLNPQDNELLASIAGCFQDGITPGKVQLGAAWWFNDQKDGMLRQLEAVSAIGLLSRFVGMLTDSRSFLSYPRHEYFRRLLCNLLGRDVEAGELPADYALLGGIVQDICYRNAARYFGLPLPAGTEGEAGG